MKKFLLFICLSLSALATFQIAGAQDQGTVTSIVSCGRINQPACGFSDLIILVQNAIRFTIFYVIVPLITLVILYYGGMMVIADNKPAQLTKAKKALWKIVIGLFFMLTAWLLVAAVIKAFDVKINEDPTQGPIKLLDIQQ